MENETGRVENVARKARAGMGFDKTKTRRRDGLSHNVYGAKDKRWADNLRL